MALGDTKVFCELIADQDNIENLNTLMKCFWKIEECDKCNSIQGDAEVYSEKHFAWKETGCYVIEMPIDPDYDNQLG